MAFAEVVQRIQLHLPDAEPVPVPVLPFSTLAAGSCIAQLGLNAAPPGTLIYHNVAPREEDQTARQENAGERLGVCPSNPSSRGKGAAGRCEAAGSIKTGG